MKCKWGMLCASFNSERISSRPTSKNKKTEQDLSLQNTFHNISEEDTMFNNQTLSECQHCYIIEKKRANYVSKSKHHPKAVITTRKSHGMRKPKITHSFFLQKVLRVLLLPFYLKKVNTHLFG